MLFARRQPLSLWWRACAWVWPTNDVRRSSRYVWLRMRRLGASPHRLALGLALGVFAACTPLLGLQFLLAGVLAWLLRGSIPAAMVGTFWANPLTCPPIWLASYGIGATMLGHDPFVDGHQVPDILRRLGALPLHVDQDSLSIVYGVVVPVLQPVLLGSVPLGLAISTLVYAVVYRLAGRAARKGSRQSRASGGATKGRHEVEPRLRWS
jgi:uncharacterized protein